MHTPGYSAFASVTDAGTSPALSPSLVELVTSLEDQYTSIMVLGVEVSKCYPRDGESAVEYQLRVERSRLLAVAVAERMAGIGR